MATRAIDISKYTNKGNPLTDDMVSQWCSEGVDLCIIQAHPAGYGQEQSLQEIATVNRHRCARHASGMPWDAYIYDYLGDDEWFNGALATLDLAAAQGYVPRMLWADEEDVREAIKAWSAQARAASIRSHLASGDQWMAAHGRPRSGIYTGRWWWQAYMLDWVEWRDRELWDSNYDHIADAAIDFRPYGGWTSCRIKQYAGTSTDVVGGLDLDVLSDAEVAEMQGANQSMAFHIGEGMANQMAAKGDAPLYGHVNQKMTDDDGQQFDYEECWGALGRYVSANSSGQWVNAGPLCG